MTRALQMLPLLALALACGGSSSPAVPTLAIGSMSATQTVGTDADKSVDVPFTLASFTLKDPGTCGSNTACGHLHVTIDGSACNATGSPYNNAATASPAVAKFAKCATATGSHVVTLLLQNDSHAPVNDAAGSPIKASITLTTN